MKWKAGQQCAMQELCESYHWKERKKKPFRAIMRLLRLTSIGKNFF